MVLDDAVEDVVDIHSVALDLLVGNLYALERIAETDEHVHIFHIASDDDEGDNLEVVDALEDAAPEGERPVGDGLQLGDVALTRLLAFVHVGDAHLDVGESLAHDVFAQQDGIILGEVEFGDDGTRIVLIVHHPETESLGSVVAAGGVEFLPELLIIFGITINHAVVTLAQEVESHIHTLLIAAKPEETVGLHC